MAVSDSSTAEEMIFPMEDGATSSRSPPTGHTPAPQGGAPSHEGRGGGVGVRQAAKSVNKCLLLMESF